MGTGHLTIDEWTNLIYKLKISVDRKFVYPYFKTVDKDNSGAIEYPEFLSYCTSSWEKKFSIYLNDLYNFSCNLNFK